MTPLILNVNGRVIEAAVEPRTSLADFLRETLNLTGTHLGCEHGVCGACTLLLDGAPARSCITPSVACHGAAVTTIEGLDTDDIAMELRAAFTREHALQCGYCTPGMLVSARDLVLRLADPSEQAIRIGMSGNLCRCTGYVGIIRAIRSVITERRARGIAPEPDRPHHALGPVGSGNGQITSVGSTVRDNKVTGAFQHAVEIPDFTPSAVLEESFVVGHTPDSVFAFFGDVAAVASCLPGAELTALSTSSQAQGAISVKLGPIAARFEGVARIERDEQAKSGRIVGMGSDQRSRSSTQAEIRYFLTPIEEGRATRVDLTIGYSLKGLLAQVGRPGLVRDIARRLIGEFVRNLDNRLSGAPLQSFGPSKPLAGGALVGAILRGWIKKIFRPIGLG